MLRIKSVYFKCYLLIAIVALVMLAPGISTQAMAAVCDVPSVTYTTIQAAVGDATCDTINVAAGTHTETGQIVINRNLTITGAGAGSTIIKKAENTGDTASGNNRGWFLINAGKSFNLSKLTLDGDIRQICIGILSFGTTTVEDCDIKNISWTPASYYGRGICLYGGSSNAVRHTTFSNIRRIGVFVFGSGISATIEGCTYVGKGDGDWLDYGVEVGAGATASITGSTISGNTGVASSDGSTSAGILVTTYFGAGTTATVENNLILNNTEGIVVGYDASDTSTVVAHYNNISGNTVYGVSSTAPAVDAENNWWGDASGPYHLTTNSGGTGNEVSDNVDYNPWLASVICGNGFTEPPGEECDDGNLINNDGCSSTCKIEVCGDGIKQTGEECDDGNLNNLDGCRNNCTLPFCGDNITDPGETCEPPGQPGSNPLQPGVCRVNTCTYCGDGIINNGESCDDGNGVNNDACRNDCTFPPLPDLVVTSLTAPSTAGANTSITIGDTTKNNGLGWAGASTTSFYLSADTVLDAGDTLLIPSRAVGALAAGASSAGTTLVTILGTTAPGKYYIIAKADAPNGIGETNENNNTRSKVITIGSDLVVSSLTAPSTAGAGTSISIGDTTKNNGPGSAGASTTSFYLSTDNVLDVTDALLGSRTPVPPVGTLAAGASNAGTTSVTIPIGTAPGRYYIIAKADAGAVVAEINENNNKRSKTINIGSDLVVSSLTVPTAAAAGSSINVTDTTKNNGPGSAGASTTDFYLSTNTTLDIPGDTFLVSRAVPELAAGASSSVTTSVAIPGSISGRYYIIAIADAGAVVGETNENNNKRSKSINIGSDLVVSSLTAPTTAGAGSSISIGDTTKNNGPGSAGASTTSFYLSTDNILDGSDTLLGSRAVGTLAVGVSSSGTTSVTIPVGTAAGGYYIIAKADAGAVVGETNEINNMRRKTITIVVP